MIKYNSQPISWRAGRSARMLWRRMMAAEHKRRWDSESVPAERLAFCTAIIQPPQRWLARVCVRAGLHIHSVQKRHVYTHSCQSFWHLFTSQPRMPSNSRHLFPRKLYVFKMFRRGSVCSLQGDQSSRFTRCLSWIQSLLPWFEIHFHQSCKTVLKMFGEAYFCLAWGENTD